MILDITGQDIIPYFKVEKISKSGSAVILTEENLSDKVLSFKVHEKEREFLTAELSIVDATGLYSKMLRYGTQVNIEWGLKKTPLFIQSFSKEVSGDYSRKAICSVISSKYSMADGIGFLTTGLRLAKGDVSIPKSRTFSKGTVRSVLNQIAQELQAEIYIDFPGADQSLSNKNNIIQANITNIAFMRFLAFKYDVKLVYQTSKNDTFKVCKIYFIDWEKQSSQSYAANRGIRGVFHYFDYGTIDSNIIGGDFDSNNQSSNGSSAVATTTPDGKVQIQFKPSPTEATEVWELNPDAVRNELEKRGLKDQTALVQEILGANEEEFLNKYRKQYFVKKTMTTAPEGYGYTGNLDVVFNPDYQVGDMAVVGSESSPIPPQFKTQFDSAGNVQKRTLWRITEIDQTIAEAPTMEIKLGR